MKNKLKVIVAAISGLVLVVSFQNCSRMEFGSKVAQSQDGGLVPLGLTVDADNTTSLTPIVEPLPENTLAISGQAEITETPLVVLAELVAQEEQPAAEQPAEAAPALEVPVVEESYVKEDAVEVPAPLELPKEEVVAVEPIKSEEPQTPAPANEEIARNEPPAAEYPREEARPAVETVAEPVNEARVAVTEAPEQEDPYVACILKRSGRSLKLGLLMQELGGTTAVSKSVCVTRSACLNDVSQKFEVVSAEDRGYCDNNPNITRLTNAAVRLLLGLSVAVK